MSEEDFACDKFAPQKWRKDVCRNCYQPARLHEKKVAKQGSSSSLTTPSTPPPSSKSATLPTSTSKSSTLPPGIKPPAPPKRVVSMKTSPGQKLPLSGTKSGTASNIPLKPAPPPMVRRSTGESVQRPAQPKVFQRFQVKKEPLIDKSVPPKERTKEKELEGVRPGTVKQVHDIAPTLKTNIPPEAQAIIDGRSTSSSAAAASSEATSDQKGSPTAKTPPAADNTPAVADGVQITDQTAQGTESKATSSSTQVPAAPPSSSPLPPPVPPAPSESPQPPILPPRPTGFDLGDSGDVSKDTAATSGQDEVAKTSSTTTTIASTGQQEADASQEGDESREVITEASQEAKESSPVIETNEKMEGEEKGEKREEDEEQQVKLEDVSASAQEGNEGLKQGEKREEQEEREGQQAKEEESDITETHLPVDAAVDTTTTAEEKEDSSKKEEPQEGGEADEQLKSEVDTNQDIAQPETETADQEAQQEVEPVSTAPSGIVEDSTATSQTEEVSVKEGVEEKKEEEQSPGAQEEKDGSGEKDKEGERSEQGEGEDGASREKEEVEQPLAESTQTQTTISETQGEDDQRESGQDTSVLAAEGVATETQQPKDGDTSGTLGDEWVLVDETMTAQLEDTLESQNKDKKDGVPSDSPSTSAEAPVDQQTEQQTAAAVEASEGGSNEAIVEGQLRQSEEEAGVSEECGSDSAAANDGQLVEQEVKPSAEEEGSATAGAGGQTVEDLAEDEEVRSKVIPQPAPSVEREEESNGGDEGAQGDDVVPPAGVPPPPPPPPIAVPIQTGLLKAVEVEKGAEDVKPPDGISAHEEVMASIRGGVTLKSVPPPPSPPPIGVPIPKGPPKAEEVKKRAESVQPPGGVSAHEEAMASIRGGVTLKSVPPPVQRRPGEDKVVDIASELRQKMLKQRRKEVETISSKLEAHKEEAEKIAKLLRDCARTHSFVHQLKSLLATADSFIAKCDIPPEMLAQKLRWPAHLVNDLREVINHMTSLEQKVAAAEDLCKQTLLSSTQPVPSPPPRAGQTGSASPSGTVKSNGSFRGVNPAAVERCVQGVVRLAKDLSTDESRYFRAAQSYPVDISDIQGLIQRAGRTVAPLIDQMYEKATQAHRSIFEASVTKFDQGFRVQNARRLLKMCCDMSDVLAMHLQLPKHALYSDAQLKYRELEEDFHNQLKVMERRGDWDSEEQLQLGTQSEVGKKLEARNKEDLQLVQRVAEALSSEEGALPEELESQLTAEVLARIELQLIKAVMAASQLKVVDGVCALKKKLYTGEDSDTLLHKHDFEWLLEAVVKGNHNLLTHLIKSCGMYVNRLSTSGMSILHRAVQRQDIPTVAHLVRLGADPLVRNAFNTTIPQMLALKCFPPSHFSDKLEEKEHLFDLTLYINNPSLSDVVLISDDKQSFHAHRIVLCAQSVVLKTMLDSEVWAESKNKEVPLPTISGRVMQLLLKYLYTGRCLFPRDDLNLGLELMAAADQLLLEPMKIQCERALSEKIDAEVVVPLYYAAFRFNTPKLLASCRHFLLSNYGEVEDPEHEALLHILDNASPGSSGARS